jgi:predicted dithiol-disulfide oxidoreductase (DUF899 family)
MAMVARAPLAKINAYKTARGWTFPWYSSFGSDFNYDFHVTLDEKVAPLEYAYRTKEEHEKAGTAYWFEGERPLELPGFSCFLRDGDSVFHTYSTYSRGGEVAITSYHLLDLTALGRQEVWEAPKGRVDYPALAAFIIGVPICSRAVDIQGTTEPLWPTKEWQTSSLKSKAWIRRISLGWLISGHGAF